MHDSILQSIGWTPLVRLRRLAEEVQATVYVKMESLNPGGSVKDRVGLAMITEAERRGWLRPGGTIIEATAGNTGVGLAMAAAVKGYRCIFVLPDKMSSEKIACSRPTAPRSLSRRPTFRPIRPTATTASPTGWPAKSPGLAAQPVRQPRQPGNSLPHHRPGDLGADRGPGHGVRRGRRHGRHHFWRRAAI